MNMYNRSTATHMTNRIVHIGLVDERPEDAKRQKAEQDEQSRLLLEQHTQIMTRARATAARAKSERERRGRERRDQSNA